MGDNERVSCQTAGRLYAGLKLRVRVLFPCPCRFSSVGRAPPLQDGSHWFKPSNLYQIKVGRQALKVTKTIGATYVESSGETPQRASVINPYKLPQLRSLNP